MYLCCHLSKEKSDTIQITKRAVISHQSHASITKSHEYMTKKLSCGLTCLFASAAPLYPTVFTSFSSFLFIYLHRVDLSIFLSFATALMDFTPLPSIVALSISLVFHLYSLGMIAFLQCLQAKNSCVKLHGNINFSASCLSVRLNHWLTLPHSHFLGKTLSSLVLHAYL